MAEISKGEIQTATMDHHGLVAAVCHDLKIAERIDRRLSPESLKETAYIRGCILHYLFETLANKQILFQLPSHAPTTLPTHRRMSSSNPPAIRQEFRRAMLNLKKTCC